MNNKIKMFEMYLKENEKAANTIEKYVRDIKEFYNWLVLYNRTPSDKYSDCRCESFQNHCRAKNFQNSRMDELCAPLVTKEILLDYKEHLKESKFKISTINSKISSINAFFTYTENETLKLKALKCQKSLFGSKEKELTKREYQRLYESCKDDIRLKLIIETIARTGIRVSELKYITRESLKIRKVIVNNKGKVRVILLPRKLCIKLLDYCCRGEACEPVFLTRNGTPINRKQIWQMMKVLADKACVSREKVFPHNLRHLFAREFYKATHDIVKLASILGHSNIETTRIYTKETEDECRIELERIIILNE